MFIRHARAALPGLAVALIPFSVSTDHEIVGNRFFPATLGIDDPGVNDELSLPTVSSFHTGDDPSFRQRDFSGAFSKRSTEAFAISIVINVKLSPSTWWTDRNRRPWLPERRHHLQVSRLQGRRARIRYVGRAERRMGRHRRRQRRS